MLPDHDTARRLATRIAKESDGVRVKFGRTNGRICLHLRVAAIPAERQARAVTIYDASEWDDDPANHANRPRKQRQTLDDLQIREAIHNREAI